MESAKKIITEDGPDEHTGDQFLSLVRLELGSRVPAFQLLLTRERRQGLPFPLLSPFPLLPPRPLRSRPGENKQE